jgi:putative flippase GtrA
LDPRSPDTPAAAPPRDGPARASFRRFLVVGATATSVQYLLLAAFIDGLGIWPAAASALSYALAVCVNYELSRRFTFYGRTASWREFVRFGAASLLGLAVNTAVFEAGLRAGLPHYLVAQVLATGAAMLVNFTVYRYWAFRD